MSNKKIIILTGGSSGLGKCLNKTFSESFNVINISRSKVDCYKNIIINLSDLTVLKEKLNREKIDHELCILNAGTIGVLGVVNKLSHKKFLEALKINVIANKIIIDWSISNGCQYFIGISSGAATKNYDGWLNYCVTKSAFRTMLLQYQKELPNLKFKLISPGILKTNMNKKIKTLDVTLFPDMKKFHQTEATDPQKASDLIFKKYHDYFSCDEVEIDLRNEKGN